MICQCGCGEEAGVYTQTHGSRGVVKGEARRFKHGHRRTPVCKHGHPRVPDNITECGHCRTCGNLRGKVDKAKHPAREKHIWLRYKYGIGLPEWEEKRLKQDNKCVLCGVEFSYETKSTTPCVDHNHETEQIRELLCDCCNKGLGSFKDNITTLNNAVQYLKKWETQIGK